VERQVGAAALTSQNRLLENNKFYRIHSEDQISIAAQDTVMAFIFAAPQTGLFYFL
jgi:hypothetical protein